MSYEDFYNKIAIALETGNKQRAADLMVEAYETLGAFEAEELEFELTLDYYQFT